LRFRIATAGASRRRLLTLLAALCAMLPAVALATASSARAADGAIAVTDDGPGRLDLWTTGPNNHVWQRTYTTAGWADWTDLGGPTGGAASEPEVIHIPSGSPATTAGKYFMFVRGANDAMWTRVFSPSTGWSAWADQGGSYASGFHAAYSSGGDWIDVVGRNKSDNNLVWRVLNQGSWTGINTSTAASLAQTPAVVDWTPSGQAPRADVFGIRTDGLIMQATNQNLAWGAWGGLNGTATSAVSGAYGDGRSMLAVRGFDSASTFVNQNTGGGWQGWVNLGGGLGTAPTIHYWPTSDGRPRWWIVAREVDNSGSGSRPAQIIMDEKIGTDAWKGWVGLSPTPDAAFYGVSTQFGSEGGVMGVIDTDDEIASVVQEIRGSTPEIARTLLDGIRPGAERDAVNAALAGSDAEATISVTHDGPDRLDLWTSGPSGAVYQRTWVSGAGWTGWWNLGAPTGGTLSSPDVILTPDGRYRIFVIGHDKALWTRDYYPSADAGHAAGWADWQSLGGQYKGGVQAGWSDNGNWVDVVARTTDDKLAWRHWVANGGWQPEDVRADGTLTGTPSVVDWTRPGQTPEMDVFTQGVDAGIFWTTNQNLAWTAWADTNGDASSPVDAAAGDNRVLLTTRGDNGTSLFGNTYQPSHGWEGWVNLGGNLSSGPTVHYWPDSSGNPRWDVVARDGGALTSTRPGQIVMTERRGSDSAWGGWVGISSVPGADYYGASVQFGGSDGINNSTEVANAVAAVRGADALVADSLLAGIVPGTERDTVQQAAFPESWARGGSDHSVTTTGEIADVLNDFDGAGSDTAAAAVLDGLSKDNRTRLTQALHARVQDGYIIRNIDNGQVFYYANNTINYIPSADFASAAGINLAAAGRTTTAALAGWTRGPDAAYSTSWRYGHENHSIDTDDERVAVLGATEDAGSLMAGVAPGDLPGLQAYADAHSADDESLSLGAITAMSTEDMAAYGVDSTAAQAAAYGTFGCRTASDTRKNKIDLGIKHLTRWTSTLTVTFCWNKRDHIVGLKGNPPHDSRALTVDIAAWGSAAGVTGTVYPLDNTPSWEYRSFDGYSRGEIAMPTWFDVHGCWFEGPLGCEPQPGHHLYHTIYAHWDGTATGRSGDR
jgi:hypothetical protein